MPLGRADRARQGDAADHAPVYDPAAMILLCYDGSEDAKVAAERAAQLFGDTPVTVLTVWEPYVELVSQSGLGVAFPPPMSDVERIDATLVEQATATADEGAALVREKGATAETRVLARGRSTATTILHVARELDAAAIVIGTRGRGGVKSMLLGSVSHAVVQHADRPVVIVPSAATTQARARHA
jgi:nucleotide-binding universal stress UspA family protein